MKKKIMSLLLCGLMIMSLAGCGEAEVDKDNTMWLEDSGVEVEFSEVIVEDILVEEILVEEILIEETFVEPITIR